MGVCYSSHNFFGYFHHTTTCKNIDTSVKTLKYIRRHTPSILGFLKGLEDEFAWLALPRNALDGVV